MRPIVTLLVIAQATALTAVAAARSAGTASLVWWTVALAGAVGLGSALWRRRVEAPGWIVASVIVAAGLVVLALVDAGVLESIRIRL